MNTSRSRRPQTPNRRNHPAETVNGVVEHIVFRSEDTGYTVCFVAPAERGQETFTLVGACPAIWVGETVSASGHWLRHPQHGLQFQANVITCVPPTSARGIERYLASGMIKGIGKVNARRIVDTFGEETLSIIERHSRRLEEVEGIGPKRRQMIKASWTEQQGVRDIMIFLQSHGVGTAQSARIYREYGANAVAVITQNPYRLCSDVWGIGFKTADAVAKSVGIPHDSDARARAGLLHVLQAMTDEGHCYAPAPELILQAQSLLDIPAETLARALRAELEQDRLVREEDRIYLKPLHRAECDVAARILALMNCPADFPPILADKAVSWAASRMDIPFAPMQAEALRMALAEKVSIITGGPGVGKTTIIRAIVEVLSARRLTLALAAPTGRAAKRMEEATGRQAQTLHRLLKYMPRTHAFEHGPGCPLPADVVILDEVSMIDLPLMSTLLGALADSTCLILVGDVDQLPSVGPGNVLRDLIASGKVPCRKLDTIFRQAAGGWIVRNAHRVNQGLPVELPETPEDSDFFFIREHDPNALLKKLLELVTSRIHQRFGFDPRNDVQVLTPMRRNLLGADNLNALLQEALNPNGPSVQRFGRHYRINDRVMQIRNNYDKGVFNGDIGSICRIDAAEQSVAVDFDGARIAYDFAELDELVLAYACSIHKSQGSEYPAVIILLATQHFKLLQRNLLYTAITRGRRLVCLLGSPKAVYIATANNRILLRRTGLRDRLSGRSAPEPPEGI